MKLEELVSRYYDSLTASEHETADYILEHQREVSSLTSEKLAKQCHISRASLLRFCKKLNLSSFAELKYLLKHGREESETGAGFDMEEIAGNYHDVIDDLAKGSYDVICEKIRRARTIYLYGTGNEQKAVAEEFKRIFLTFGKYSVDLFDCGEAEFAMELFTEQDLFLIISLSGETESGIRLLKLIEPSRIPTLSITRWKNNTISRLCDYNLYAGTKTLIGSYHLNYEMVAAFYVLLDILSVRYLELIRRETDEA